MTSGYYANDLVQQQTAGTQRQTWTLDSALLLPADSSVAPTVLDYDEYGNPRAGQDAVRYGWLGGKQRSSETPTGVTLMGVRLYNPTTGRFLSVDPVPGGSANAYEYCNGDPINQYDLDGRYGWFRRHFNRWSANALGRGLSMIGSHYMHYRCGYRSGMRVCRGGQLLHGRGGTTIGNTYFTDNNRNYVTPERLRHEKRHMRQWQHYGLGFIVRYIHAGSNPCRNRFEREANLRWGGYQC